MAISRFQSGTNKRILLVAVSMVIMMLLGPGLFGLSPPKWNLKSGDDQAMVPDRTMATPSATSKTDQMLDENASGGRLKNLSPDPVFRNRAHLVDHFPQSHFELSGAAQKQSFLDIVLPLIVAANDEIIARRVAINSEYEAGDRLTLEKWAQLYKVDTTGLTDIAVRNRLLHRADIIPVPIALAQAAIESGWGTSRFARQGNALFGQWAWKQDAGIRPLKAENERHVVRRFDSLFASVRAYMHNLNTHRNYTAFRAVRAHNRNSMTPNQVDLLVQQLDGYAEIGIDYVRKLETLIRTNDFYRFTRP